MKWMSGIAAMVLWSVVPALAEGAEDWQKETARVQDLVRRHAAGMEFKNIKSRSGDSFDDVVIKSVTAGAVAFRHAGGEGELPAADCPELWMDLFGLGAATETAADPATAEFREPGPEVAEAIVVIEGDNSTGTGFFCRAEGQVFLYSAAHVLSGNSKLKVKLRDGSVVRKFGALQAAEGGDMIRLPLEQEVPHALEIAAEAGVAAVGIPVFASGNAGGGGTVGYEKGTIKGVGPESIEIDAEVIQGNSGGPILHGDSHVAMGVVTHLTAARKDLWAKETRYAEVRRFGCRLDRQWKWKTVPVDVFLKEGRAIQELQDQSDLMVAALQPAQWDTAVFRQQRDNPLARDITALNAWIEEQRRGGQRFSESDRKKRLRGIFESGRHRSRAQLTAFNCINYTWFHRERGNQEVTRREEIDKAYENTVNDLR
ncbi:trypsin-like peptidase domain-containing protein [Luteolibacter marinus]|uniref:trypsin-like peptidase domain-containing protein n=1 Tax=Luteolibacter marinus TaxID=2776705 RepID=UPI0018667CEF|nr:trypsin-like peptidase domain-containing protein [Luteolibacter marinus]